KTMNTHLHILEAYSNLYRILREEKLRLKIKDLLQNFSDYIIDKETSHLILFFDENWMQKSTIISYGHDIEASWLLQEAAEIINDEELIALTKQIAVKMASAAKQGIDKDGGLWYEYEPSENHLIKEKHWWPQAEAMVGFFNAWQVSGKNEYLQLSLRNWDFTKKYIIDKQSGEWIWGINEDYSAMKEQDKVGIWKCPYHNSRACIEIIKRIGSDTARGTI
ncbi:MAG: AGE family epimerase/isomerase, partial [Bacteroidota bacterium]